MKKCKVLFVFPIACLLNYGLENYDFQRVVGPINARVLENFTPIFPGIDHLEKHSVFDPQYSNKKKIVLLGPSYTDSIGCDKSWSVPDNSRRPKRNVSVRCRIDFHLNNILRERGHNEWRVFNLARNGAQLMHMLYVYAAIYKLKPEIVIYGGGTYLFKYNAGMKTFTDKKKMAELEKFFW